MTFVPMIPAEKYFREKHSGEGHNLVVKVEGGATNSIEGGRSLPVQIFSCEPCHANIKIPFIPGIYWNPFRETG